MEDIFFSSKNYILLYSVIYDWTKQKCDIDINKFPIYSKQLYFFFKKIYKNRNFILKSRNNIIMQLNKNVLLEMQKWIFYYNKNPNKVSTRSQLSKSRNDPQINKSFQLQNNIRKENNPKRKRLIEQFQIQEQQRNKEINEIMKKNKLN